MTVRVAVAGAGVMGANHARILSLTRGADLVLIVDPDAGRARTLASRFGCPWTSDLDQLDQAADAVIVAVPTSAHAEVAHLALDMGLDVLIEKPLAQTSVEAAGIVRKAEERARVLAVGHVERFNPACLDLPRFVRRPLFFSARRASPYTIRIEEGVVTDLMIHDIDILLALTPDAVPTRVKTEMVSLRSATEDIAVATVMFDTGLIAHFHASRMAQQKVRDIEIVEDDVTVSADLLRQDITIRRQASVEYVDDGGRRLRESTIMEIPFLLSRGEPLQLELEDFLDAIVTRRRPRVGGAAGLRALDLCEKVRLGHWEAPAGQGRVPDASLAARGHRPEGTYR